MNYTEIGAEQLSEFVNRDIDGPFQMINLLKFKTEIEQKGITGAQQYDLYMQSAAPFFKKSGAKIVYLGQTATSLIGPVDLEWDKILIIHYETKESFIKMITTPGYPAHERSLALEDSRLIFSQSR